VPFDRPEATRYGSTMQSKRSDLPAVLAAVVATVLFGVITYGAVKVAIVDHALDTNSPNATTSGPPASFSKP
jgi:hypothetical protein